MSYPSNTKEAKSCVLSLKGGDPGRIIHLYELFGASLASKIFLGGDDSIAEIREQNLEAIARLLNKNPVSRLNA
jgi:hypothetical protein